MEMLRYVRTKDDNVYRVHVNISEETIKIAMGDNDFRWQCHHLKHYLN